MSDGGDPTSKPKVREATAGDAGAIHSLAGELAGVVGDSSPHFEDVRARPFMELLMGVASLWINTDRLSRLVAS